MKRKKRSGSRTEKETTTKVLFMWWRSDTLEMKVSREEAWTVCLRNLWKAILVLCHNGGLSSMVKIVGIQIQRPLVRSPGGAGWGTVFLFLRVNSCADLFVPDLPLCVRHAPKSVHVKYPISICHKSWWFGNMKTLHTCKKEERKKDG